MHQTQETGKEQGGKEVQKKSQTECPGLRRGLNTGKKSTLEEDNGEMMQRMFNCSRLTVNIFQMGFSSHLSPGNIGKCQ